MATITICDGCKSQGEVKVLNGTDYAHVPFLGNNRRYLDLCTEGGLTLAALKGGCANAYWKFKQEVEQFDRDERKASRDRRERHLSEFYGRLKNGPAQDQTEEEGDESLLHGSECNEPHRIIEPGD